jgi:hypothetical protein
MGFGRDKLDELLCPSIASHTACSGFGGQDREFRGHDGFVPGFKPIQGLGFHRRRRTAHAAAAGNAATCGLPPPRLLPPGAACPPLRPSPPGAARRPSSESGKRNRPWEPVARGDWGLASCHVGSWAGSKLVWTTAATQTNLREPDVQF